MTVTEIETAFRSHGYGPEAAHELAMAVVKHAQSQRDGPDPFVIQRVSVVRDTITYEINAAGVVSSHAMPIPNVFVAEIRDAVDQTTAELRENLTPDHDGPEVIRPANASNDNAPVQVWGTITSAMDQNMLITANNGVLIVFLFLATGVALSDRFMVAIAFALAGVSYLANVAQSMEREKTTLFFLWCAGLGGLAGYVYAAIRLLIPG